MRSSVVGPSGGLHRIGISRRIVGKEPIAMVLGGLLAVSGLLMVTGTGGSSSAQDGVSPIDRFAFTRAKVEPRRGTSEIEDGAAVSRWQFVKHGLSEVAQGGGLEGFPAEDAGGVVVSPARSGLMAKSEEAGGEARAFSMERNPLATRDGGDEVATSANEEPYSAAVVGAEAPPRHHFIGDGEQPGGKEADLPMEMARRSDVGRGESEGAVDRAVGGRTEGGSAGSGGERFLLPAARGDVADRSGAGAPVSAIRERSEGVQEVRTTKVDAKSDVKITAADGGNDDRGSDQDNVEAVARPQMTVVSGAMHGDVGREGRHGMERPGSGAVEAVQQHARRDGPSDHGAKRDASSSAVLPAQQSLGGPVKAPEAVTSQGAAISKPSTRNRGKRSRRKLRRAKAPTRAKPKPVSVAKPASGFPGWADRAFGQ